MRWAKIYTCCNVIMFIDWNIHYLLFLPVFLLCIFHFFAWLFKCLPYQCQTLLDDKLEPLRLTDEQLEDFSLMLTSQPCSSVEAESSCQRMFPGYAMPGAIVDDLSAKEWEREQRRLSNETKARQPFHRVSSPTRRASAPKSPIDTPVGTNRENSWQPHQAWLPPESGKENALSTLPRPVFNEKETANSDPRVDPLTRNIGKHHRQNQEATNEW